MKKKNVKLLHFGGHTFLKSLQINTALALQYIQRLCTLSPTAINIVQLLTSQT